MINARFAMMLSLVLSHSTIASTIDLYDNLSNTSSGSYTANTSLWQAQRFQTDNQVYSLSKVTLSMQRIEGNGGAIVQIYSNTVTNIPGSPLHTLTSPGSYSDTSLADTNFTAAGFDLAANSAYWVVLKSGDGNTYFNWSWTSDVTGTGPGFTTDWSQTSDLGSNWSGDSIDPYQMRVTVQPVPEPSSMILMSLGMIAAGFAVRRKSRRIR